MLQNFTFKKYLLLFEVFLLKLWTFSFGMKCCEKKCCEKGSLDNIFSSKKCCEKGAVLRNGGVAKRATTAVIHFIELNSRIMGYNAGFIRDEYNCNSVKCECAIFDQTVIGKPPFFKFSNQTKLFR